MPTYKQFKKFLRDKCWNERDYGEGIYDKLIYDFLVEEVKENEEYSSINEFCALNGVSEQHRAMLNTFLAIEHTKANSILKKLKADIEKRIEENEGAEAGTEYAKGAYYAYKNIEMLLTPLETKEDREANGR